MTEWKSFRQKPWPKSPLVLDGPPLTVDELLTKYQTLRGEMSQDECVSWDGIDRREKPSVARPLPDAERIARRIARHVTGEYEEDVQLVTALLREEGVAE